MYVLVAIYHNRKMNATIVRCSQTTTNSGSNSSTKIWPRVEILKRKWVSSQEFIVMYETYDNLVLSEEYVQYI